MFLKRPAKIIFLTLITLSIILTGMSCSSNSTTTASTPTEIITPVTTTVIQTTTATATVTKSSVSTVTVTETLSPTTTNTTTVTVPATTTSGWTIVPTTTTTPPPPTVSVPTNKTLLMTDKITLPVYDEAAFQQDANNIKFLPYTGDGVYISTTFSLNPDVYYYLDVQSDSPLDSSGLGIPFDLSGGQGSKILVNKIVSTYGSLKINFNPSWIYAYEQTNSGSTWETKFIIHSADLGTYALYFINTSGKTNSLTYWAYTWK